MTIPSFEVMFHVVFKKGTIPYICYWWNHVSFFVGSFTKRKRTCGKIPGVEVEYLNLAD